MTDSTIEIIGYIAMALIAISFLMKEIRLLRIFNLLGAFTFIVYGVLLDQAPIYLLNSFILLVHVYYLLKPKTEKK
ncbi:MAG: uroporphyrinogen decarboxylase [Flavobacteriales bacterium]